MRLISAKLGTGPISKQSARRWCYKNRKQADITEVLYTAPPGARLSFQSQNIHVGYTYVITLQ